MKEWPRDLDVAGKPIPRRSALDKVTGRARFSADVRLPGMLHAAIARSKIARGRVLSIDASRAERVPGIRWIMTPWNLPPMREPAWAPLVATVRFVGEEIAAVVAETEQAAEEAAAALAVKYEEQRPVIEPEDARIPEDLVGGSPAIYERGDLIEGEREADFTLEQRYSTEVQHHNPLEPHCCVAAWQNGVLTLWDSNQGVHAVKDHLAERFGLPVNRIRVVNEHVGGGFGSKNRAKPYHYIAAIASQHTGRPVRVWHDRRDEFVVARHRAKSAHRLRGGVTEEGRLTFLLHEAVGQDGADPLRAGFAAGCDFTGRLYRCSNVRTEVRQVHTNTQSPVVFRGPLAAEELFCLEQFIDELAHLTSLDPLRFRLANHAERDQVDGRPYSSKALRECYRLGAERFGWDWHRPGSDRGAKKRGIGMSSMIFHGFDFEPSQVQLTLDPDGTATVAAGVSDMGAGVETVLAQIAAEELGVPFEHVSVVLGDSAHTPYSIDSSYGSRTTAMVGPAVRAAAEEAKRQRAKHPGSREPIIAIGRRHAAPPGVSVQTFAAHFVEVEIDTDTGRIRVLRAVCAHDSGRWINPLLVESQIQGGFLQGMGMALFEERSMDRRNGMMLNDNMLSYFMPTILDAPGELIALEVPTLDPSNTINAKGVGEPPLVAAGAAIANAVYNAIGTRIRSYPLTPNKVLAALS